MYTCAICYYVRPHNFYDDDFFIKQALYSSAVHESMLLSR